MSHGPNHSFAVPFLFNEGAAVTLEHETDQFAAQQISAVLQTRLDELYLTPRFGTKDPAFTDFDYASFYGALGTYEPTIRVTDISYELNPEGGARLRIEFTRREN